MTQSSRPGRPTGTATRPIRLILIAAIALITAVARADATEVSCTPEPCISSASAVDAAIRFLRARMLARPSRPVEATLPPELLPDSRTGMPATWQVALKWTSPRYGQPAEGVLYVDARTEAVLEADHRIEPMITWGNESYLERLAARLRQSPLDLANYREWARYFAWRGHERHERMARGRVTTLSVFEPEGSSHYRMIFSSPRRLNETRAFTATLPLTAKIHSLEVYCPGQDPLTLSRVFEPPKTANNFAYDKDPEAGSGCRGETRTWALVVELNHRDAERFVEQAEGLLAVTPSVTTWAFSPVSSMR